MEIWESAIIYDFSENFTVCFTRPGWVFLMEQWPDNLSSAYRAKEVNMKYNFIKKTNKNAFKAVICGQFKW